MSATARVDPSAVIGARTHIGEYCVIESDVVIGADCKLEPYVYVKRWTTIGDGNEISAGTALGTDPLDKAFTGERSYLVIGHRNKIREHFTISRGTKPESETRIGDDNYVMTAGHIAHNCVLGSNITVASCTLIAGYVEVEDQAFISGGVGVHQFCKIGKLAMVAGHARVNVDLPPFFLYSAPRVSATGLNAVGLRRAGMSREQVSIIRVLYEILYRRGIRLKNAIEHMQRELPGPLTEQMVHFLRNSRRGIARESVSRSSGELDMTE